ncbi:cytochrome c oxidase subunit 3 [Halobacillus mangrovi]|uniref:Cytochrome aa3 quinol oxidase subunit III n=1 Tax=Halobacillus mangrovi TaxID=402384 RepID=A0A1W5ZRS6_9BACI|nr:cytochrome c oxidase subunit 3 [Halobacillus mangrovi]ARI76010.1 cytochrome aa3 quinol oxidase subunit III [Halobacillus mangrovi]
MKQTSDVLFQDKRLGFFLYLVVEAFMFATLFATYIIFTPPSVGANPSEVYELRTVILTSVFLLSSSGTLLIAESGLEHWNLKKIWIGIITTFLLGAVFMGLEIHEFYKYTHEGFTITMNNFLSSFYVLVGLHASHVAFGLGWMILLMVQLKQQKLPKALFIEKHKIFNYYWHFVDVVWVMIILIVYAPYLF